MAGGQNGRLSWPCAMAGNFGFRGQIGLSGPDLFGSFWGNAKKNNGNEHDKGLSQQNMYKTQSCEFHSTLIKFYTDENKFENRRLKKSVASK
ncbi:MAG: hypothetical protein PWQ06_841 [Anaerophaga sp.]|nr:hypothetical protein [Anaerophaga sp.]